MRKFVLFFLNNIIINRILIWTGKDHFIKRFGNDWSKNKLDRKKTMQENVGFSHSPDVDLAVKKIHDYINNIEKRYLKVDDSVLDIGCGVGLYLKDFENKKIYGTDLNKEFLDVCKNELPFSILKVGDYLKLNFENVKFNFVYSISVIEYIPPSEIQNFFDKIYSELAEGGFIAIQYPHALSWKDKYYSDLSYISYHPQIIEKCLEHKFETMLHEHSFDQRKVPAIDSKRYGEAGKRNFCNGMILIARKKS
jgi:cyclopropane fatty-acyl-phospholipid synthase-like methyltransferase